MPHAVQLRDGDVRLVDEEEEVLGEVVEQRWRRFAGKTAGEVARVVLDAVAVTDGLDHLEVETGSLVNALRLDETALRLELLFPPFHLGDDGFGCGLLALGLNDIMRLRVDGKARVLLADGAEEWVDLRERVDLVAEELDAIGVFVVGGKDLDDVAADAERCRA